MNTEPATTTPATPETETAVNPLDELGANIESFRNKLRLALDESAILARKVKEAQISQKQKERDFIQAKRAIERIRMAI